MKSARTDADERWVAVESAGALLSLEDRDAVSWVDAPLPPRLHRCRAQTRGILSTGTVYRCACGAISRDGRWWSQRNARRRGEGRRRDK